jgi:hypothetical protein
LVDYPPRELESSGGPASPPGEYGSPSRKLELGPGAPGSLEPISIIRTESEAEIRPAGKARNRRHSSATARFRNAASGSKIHLWRREDY